MNKFACSCIFILSMGFGALPASAGLGDFLRDLLGGKQDTDQSSESGSGIADLLTDQDMIDGVLEALTIGAHKSIDTLGRDGGFLNDLAVRIAIPEDLKTVERSLRSMGQDRLADEFITTMNHAAERAIPATTDIIVGAIKGMSLTDAHAIVKGPDDAATQYFRQTSGAKLQDAVLPIVAKATDDAGVTYSYKQMIDRIGFLGKFINTEALDLDRYITDKALDGLFLKLAEEEKAIRKDPIARTTDLLKRVFGG